MFFFFLLPLNTCHSACESQMGWVIFFLFSIFFFLQLPWLKRALVDAQRQSSIYPRDRGLLQVALARVHSTVKREIKPKHINQRTTVTDSEWSVLIQPFSLVPQYSLWSYNLTAAHHNNWWVVTLTLVSQVFFFFLMALDWVPSIQCRNTKAQKMSTSWLAFYTILKCYKAMALCIPIHFTNKCTRTLMQI